VIVPVLALVIVDVHAPLEAVLRLDLHLDVQERLVPIGAAKDLYQFVDTAGSDLGLLQQFAHLRFQ
jgi:hypothetical protein